MQITLRNCKDIETQSWGFHQVRVDDYACKFGYSSAMRVVLDITRSN